MFNSFCIFFSSISLTCSIVMVQTQNPVFSVLFLILCFCNISGLCFILGLELLPIIFLIVYVGAVAVLFLFAVLFLNLNIIETRQNKYFSLFTIIFLTILFFSQFILSVEFEIVSFSENILMYENYKYFFNYLLSLYTNFSNNLTYLQETNIYSVGYIIFTKHYSHLILISILLLFALVAVIYITLQKVFFNKRQNVHNQILHDFKTCIVSYK